jgi:hypothetical protein
MSESLQCTTADQPDAGPCEGEVSVYWSRSGLTSTERCEGHQRAHWDALDAIAQRYPDSDTPPAWFDPTYAGESWNDDY